MYDNSYLNVFHETDVIGCQSTSALIRSKDKHVLGTLLAVISAPLLTSTPTIMGAALSIPSYIALPVGAFLLLHIRNWPLYWHGGHPTTRGSMRMNVTAGAVRMVWPFLAAAAKFYTSSGSKRVKYDKNSAKGVSPFDAETVWYGFAGASALQEVLGLA